MIADWKNKIAANTTVYTRKNIEKINENKDFFL